MISNLRLSRPTDNPDRAFRGTSRDVASDRQLVAATAPVASAGSIGVDVTAAAWALLLATFVASFVEAVEATTIIMAMGFTRSWRSTWAGVATALIALAVVTAIFGYALTS